MKARSPRSSATRCTCCSARPASSPTMPRARSPARLSSTPCRRRSASAGAQKGVALGATRIGVHAGPAMVGNFGGGRFFDYTAYGDTINIAARLEAANKQLGTRICVSASAAATGRRFPRPAGRRPRAAGAGARRCALSSPCRPSSMTTRRRRAISRRSAGWRPATPSALGAFAAQVGKRPDDQLASFHLKRLLNGATGTRIAMD